MENKTEIILYLCYFFYVFYLDLALAILPDISYDV